MRLSLITFNLCLCDFYRVLCSTWESALGLSTRWQTVTQGSRFLTKYFFSFVIKKKQFFTKNQKQIYYSKYLIFIQKHNFPITVTLQCLWTRNLTRESWGETGWKWSGKTVRGKENPSWIISVEIKNKSRGLTDDLSAIAQARHEEYQPSQHIILHSPQISVMNKQRGKLACKRTISINTI